MKTHHHHHSARHVVSSRTSAEPAPETVETSPDTVRVDLEARETEWEIAPGSIVAGYGYNGRVPGPVIE
ncbi:MAG TPA: hypothetical protein VFZ53_31120, partial [Polyangiaceae bacterium]